MGKKSSYSPPRAGSGKTTIVRRLLERYPQFEFSISATSRAPRGQERDGWTTTSSRTGSSCRPWPKTASWSGRRSTKATCYGTLRSEVERIWAKGNIIVFSTWTCRRHQPQAHLRRRRLLGVHHAALGRGAAPTARRPRHGRPGGDRPPVAKAEFELTKSPRVRPHRGKRLSLDEAVRETTAIIDQFIAR